IAGSNFGNPVRRAKFLPTFMSHALRYLHDWRFDMKRVILFALLWIVPLRIFAADAIPDNRKPFGGTWAGKVGVPGGIPNRTIIFRTQSGSHSGADSGCAG